MLGDDLEVEAGIDLAGIFGGLVGVLADVDLSDVSFDATDILDVAAGLTSPDVVAVVQAVTDATTRLDAAVATPQIGSAASGVADSIGQLSSALDLIRQPVNLPMPGSQTGIGGLSSRIEDVEAVLGAEPVAALLGIVPGLDLSDGIPIVRGPVAGLLSLAQALVALSATSSISSRVERQAAVLGRQLDVDAARAAADDLGRLANDTGLVASVRGVDAHDLLNAQRAVERTAAFQGAVLRMRDTWSVGMGFGEAALVDLDLGGAAARLDLARIALETTDQQSVAALAESARDALAPVLALPMPDPAELGADVVEVGLGHIQTLTATIDGWDAASAVEPVAGTVEAVTAPVQAVARQVEQVATQAAAAIRTVRDLVDTIDMTSVIDTVRSLLAPIEQVLDAIEQAVSLGETELRAVATAIQGAMDAVSAPIHDAASVVQNALGRVRDLLDGLGLDALATTIEDGLGVVVDALQAADLTPYFDSAIDVIDTSATVVDAVPFSLLPTDLQQEVVDVCRPIKELDLQTVEDTLRGELAGIRMSLGTDALDAIEEAFASVIEAIESLDPEPHLVELENGALADLRSVIESVDPTELLAPVDEALDQIRDVLDGVDLENTVLRPLGDALTPVVTAVRDLDPAELLAPVTEGLAEARSMAEGLLNLDAAEQWLDRAHGGLLDLLSRLDLEDLADALDDEVAEGLRRLVRVGGGNPVPGLVAALARAGGIDADDDGAIEALLWVQYAGQAPTGGGASDVVSGRLLSAQQVIGELRDAVRDLDPGPVVAAAQSQHRALAAAVEAAPDDSALKVALLPLLSGPGPGEVLGPLVENRRRYLVALGESSALSADLAASARTEVSATAAGVRTSLAPLEAVQARAREVLTLLGLAGPDDPLTTVLTRLLDVAGPERLLPRLVGVVQSVTRKLVELVEAAMNPLRYVLGSAQGLIDLLDITPVLDDLTALHEDVVAQVESLTPEALLGGTLAEAAQTLERVADFDPLAPVRDVLDGALSAATGVLDTARPTVVFADVIGVHRDVRALAGGLDVRRLLEPVLTSLTGLAEQLDDGFDRTGDSLQRLQAALPDSVSGNSAGGSAEVSLG